MADLHARARALSAAGKPEAAIPLLRRHLQAVPGDRIAWHNLGSALGNTGRHQEALEAAGRAIGLGLQAPETLLIRGRAALNLNRLDEAEAAFRRALASRPADPAAHRELAQLVWMRTGSAEEAVRLLAAAFQQDPRNLPLRVVVCEVLTQIGQKDRAAALASETASLAPHSAEVRRFAAGLLLSAGDGAGALPHAEAACRLERDVWAGTELLAQVRLALGDAAEAGRLLETDPSGEESVFTLALLAVVRRLLQDERYGELYDYTRKVRSIEIDAPKGWSSAAAYLRDLREDLQQRHGFKSNPFGQSVKGGGSQLGNLTGLGSAALDAWPEAVAGPVRDHFASQGLIRPARSKVKGRLKPWSVRLRAGGHHSDHIHPGGLFSSACHLSFDHRGAAPEGWLRFGKPGLRLPEELGAEYLVRPEPGRLVLFPSFMWHGVEPITGKADRLTIAMDVVP
jgi:tetratricopeptide (TPR) repeat protein